MSKYDPDCIHCMVAKFLKDRGGLRSVQGPGSAAETISRLMQCVGEICDSFPKQSSRDELRRHAFLAIAECLDATVQEFDVEEGAVVHH